MGIENYVRQRYGDDYWERNKKEILRQADRNDQLEKETVPYNARTRRAMARHPESFRTYDLQQAGVWQDLDRELREFRRLEASRLERLKRRLRRGGARVS